jgi:hypothetical protein
MSRSSLWLIGQNFPSTLGQTNEFEIERIDDKQEKIYFTLGRKTDLYEEILPSEKPSQNRMERLF